MEGFPLPLGAWVGLRYFIVALPEPSIQLFRDEISHFDGLMLKGEKVIIPKSMQKSVIEQIHKKSHLGINKCINRLKDVFFWSGVMRDKF